MTGSIPRPSGCPPWCDSDHSRDVEGLPPLHFAAAGPSVRLSETPGAEHVFVFISQSGRYGVPALIVRGSTNDAASDPAFTVSLKDAGDAAQLIEMIAVASPQAHREVAAALRRGAARGGER